ncbi:hypothetical protein [Bradyrhizobium sp. RDM4]|uniref:hypothetical protein n=1 Tax=Bradyrhizobium sp. RDM4 TaxID=3378765 RepID=UPI0038FC822F
MKKRRGTVWDGIRDAHNVHEAFQLIESLRHRGGNVLHELRELALLAAALALVVAVFWLIGYVAVP